jgi:hypothetical protein
MRLWHGIAAIGVGALAGAAWQYWLAPRPPIQWPPAHHPRDKGEIALVVVHEGPALRLEWNPEGERIRDAAEGTLTITDAGHVSRLHLDPPELSAGQATYWPEGRHVEFRMETDSGAFGQVDAPAEPRPAEKRETRPIRPAQAKPASHSHAHAVKPVHHSASADRALADGLEWTADPPPPKHESKWSKLKRRLGLR